MTSRGAAGALAVGLAVAGSAIAAADSAPGPLVNRMASESSSYLRRHVGDPVAWQPWGEEAFALAQRLGRPVFVSIGFFSCHWCHVLQEESFGDAEIARLLNERYVPVLVDRDERPDVDAVYQAAVAEVGGSGGWPLNLWLTPEREPFFGASYLPKEDGERGFERGLRTVLDRLASSWSADPGAVRATAGRVAGLAVDRMRPPPPADLPSPAEVTAALGRVLASVDPVHGGRRGGPKFPLGLPLEWMLRDGGEAARAALERTLDGLVGGGVHDAVGGGFFRYAVDPAWRRPHFEKLLGDQARIAVVLLEAGRRLDRPDLVAASRRTLEFVVREMLLPDGGFASALDADSPGPDGRPCEGCFYTWTEADLDVALEPGAALALRSRFAIEPLEPSGDRGVLVRKPGSLDGDRRVAEALASLLAERHLRPKPPRDERPSLAASGLAVGAFARAALVLEEASFEGIARRAAAASLAEREKRRAAGGGAPETLDDLAAMVAGLLDLYEASGDARWFESAVALSSEIDDGYADSASGGYFLLGPEADSPLLRPRSLDDGPLPAGASLQAMSLLRIAAWTGDDRPRRRAIEVLRSSAPALLSSPWTRGDSALALRFLAADPVEVVLVAPRDLSELTALRVPLRAPGAPDRVLSLTTSERAALDAAKIPLLAGKRAISGRATAYVCRRHVCERPTSDPAELERQLRGLEVRGSTGRETP